MYNFCYVLKSLILSKFEKIRSAILPSAKVGLRPIRNPIRTTPPLWIVCGCQMQKLHLATTNPFR